VVEWPDTYEGNGGVAIKGDQAGSRSDRIAVTGRTDQ
jgi:hypothetical protein